MDPEHNCGELTMRRALIQLALGVVVILASAACADGSPASIVPPRADLSAEVSDLQATVPSDVRAEPTESAETDATIEADSTESDEPSPAPTETPEPHKQLTVCLPGDAPDLLHIGDNDVTTAVDHALYENLFTSLGYAYQAAGLEKLPSLADGDARRTFVEVNEGDLVVDAAGEVVSLRDGVEVITADGGRVSYSGQPLALTQLAADFTLKPMVWSDGTPVTAVDSVFAFNLAADPAAHGAKGKTIFTARYEATGDLSVRWTGLPGYLDPLYFTNVWTPLPAHEFSGLSVSEIEELERDAQAMLSSGPYVASEWRDEQTLVLVANEHYYRASEGLPRVPEIILRYGEPQTLLTDGGCDVLADGVVGMHNVEELTASGSLDGYEVRSAPGNVYEQIAFGITPVIEYAERRPDWFGDVRVRQALTMCTDRERMLEEITGGRGELLHTLTPPGHPLTPEDLTIWDFDPAEGNALLDASGYQDYAGDGRRQDVSSGVPMTVTLGTNSESTIRVRIGELFQENMAGCGIPVTTYQLPAGTWFSPGPQGPLFGRQFDLAGLAWLGRTEPDCTRFSGAQIPGPAQNPAFAGWDAPNISGWSNEAFDAACLQANATLPGEEGHASAQQETLRLFNQELPVIPLFTDYKAVAVRPSVQNTAIDPTQASALWNIGEWDLTE